MSKKIDYCNKCGGKAKFIKHPIDKDQRQIRNHLICDCGQEYHKNLNGKWYIVKNPKKVY